LCAEMGGLFFNKATQRETWVRKSSVNIHTKPIVMTQICLTK
jgi:hypothetical protein